MGFNKKVLSKAVSELDKAKAPAKPRDIITDPAGQWKYPGQKTRIPGSSITMQGVNYPVWAQPNVGPGSMMQPNQDYNFPDADYVDETPIGRRGGTLKSKRYSSNISATNKLFTKNKLFQSKKHKIFDPNAKFKSGGSKLGPINLNPNPLSHYELNYGFNLPTKQDGGPQYTFPERDLYPEEDEYFKNNPHVGGMAAEDNHVIINPYSKLKDYEKDAIRQNEGARLAMRNGHPRPTFNLTDEQKEKFKDYSNDEQDQRETIIGRIISGDPSVGKVSPEQQAYADELSKLLKPAVSLKNTSGPRNNIIQDDEYMDLTDEEIQAYRDGGYVVEELPEAQDGRTVYSGPNLGLQGPTSSKSNGAPTVANAKVLEKERKNTLPKKQQFVTPKIKIPTTVAEADRMIETGEIIPSKPSTPEEDYQTTKSMIDAAGTGFYPAAVVGSALDALEGNYSNAAMGLIPFVGKAGKHGKLWGKAYTKGYNALAPKIGYANAHKILYPLKHLGKGISSGSSLGFQGVDTYNDNPFNVLDEKEIGGYVQHELAKAQGGKTVYSGVNNSLKGPSSPKPKVKKTDTSPSVANAKKLAQFYKLQEQKKQQTAAKQKEIELMKHMPKTQVSDNTRTVTPNQAVSDVRNTAILNSPEYKAQQKAKKDAQAAFEKEQWKKYNKASTMEKIVDRSQAALSQPLLMASNALMGDQAYVPGMHEGLMNTESPDYDKFLSATGQSRGLGINDVFNTFNPGNWGAHAANEMDKGNVVSGAAEMGLGLLGLKGLKTASGLVKGSAKALNKAEGKLTKFIPERAPGAPSTGGGNLNAGISPELITNFVGAKNKVGANFLDNSYFNLLGNKTVNKLSPLNLIPGYGKKLEGAVKPLGNVIGNSIKDGKLVESRSLFNKAKGLVKKGPDADLTTKVGKTNASDVYSASFDNVTDGSKINIGPANQQGFIGKTFNKSNASYPIQNSWGTNLKQIPLASNDVNLHRRLPFSNRYVPIDKEKLMNNKFQLSTTGAGAQKLAEKFVTSPVTGAGIVGGYTAATYDPLDYVEDEGVREQMRIENLAAPSDVPTRAQAVLENVGSSISAPSEYLKENADPYFLRTAATAVKGNLKQGGTIEEVWEDELDDHTIALLRKAGYTVEELD